VPNMLSENDDGDLSSAICFITQLCYSKFLLIV